MATKTALDLLSTMEECTVELKDLQFVRKNKTGTINFVFKLNGETQYLNYVDLEDLKAKKTTDDKVRLKYGKLDSSWKNSYWYLA